MPWQPIFSFDIIPYVLFVVAYKGEPFIITAYTMLGGIISIYELMMFKY
jgi:hypothetical protein